MAPLKDEWNYFTRAYPRTWYWLRIGLYIITCPFCFSFCCFCCCNPNRCAIEPCGTGRMQRRRQRAEYKLKSATNALFEHKGRKLKRRQSLSTDSPTTLFARLRRKPVADQTSSPLFSKLPVEVRERIYEYVLLDPGAVVYGFRRPDIPGDFLNLRGQSCVPTGEADENYIPEMTLAKSGNSISLLQTCRWIYTEALPILYCNTQFVFQDVFALKAFSHITPQSKIEKIRSVRINSNSWSGHWNNIYADHFQAWKNLRELYIGYAYHHFCHNHPKGYKTADVVGSGICAIHLFVYHVYGRTRGHSPLMIFHELMKSSPMNEDESAWRKRKSSLDQKALRWELS